MAKGKTPCSPPWQGRRFVLTELAIAILRRRIVPKAKKIPATTHGEKIIPIPKLPGTIAKPFVPQSNPS
jgi:hypothetical protein